MAQSMESLINDVMEQASIIHENGPKAKEGNKAAARRLRVATLELGNRVGLEFRKRSVQEIG